jgi:hypothetical protein
MRPHIRILLFALLGGGLLLAASGWTLWQLMRHAAAHGFFEVAAPRPVKRHTCPCNTSTVKLGRRDPYGQHLRAAVRWPGARIHHGHELAQARSDSDLVPFGPSTHRRIAGLTHSHDLLHPGAADVFTELEHRFRTAVEGTPEADARIVISSLYRTREQQRSLCRVNRNAIDGRSSHNYGASIDIKALETRGRCSVALERFQDVLQGMRREKRLLVIREGECLHLTARR